jgi:hypothetical protein
MREEITIHSFQKCVLIWAIRTGEIGCNLLVVELQARWGRVPTKMLALYAQVSNNECMNWVNYLYLESECLGVFVGVNMYEDFHNNLVGPTVRVKLRNVHSMQVSVIRYGQWSIEYGVLQYGIWVSCHEPFRTYWAVKHYNIAAYVCLLFKYHNIMLILHFEEYS